MTTSLPILTSPPMLSNPSMRTSTPIPTRLINVVH